MFLAYDYIKDREGNLYLRLNFEDYEGHWCGVDIPLKELAEKLKEVMNNA